MVTDHHSDEEMELQHVNFKIFVDAETKVEATAFIKLFHGWIQTQAVEGLLIDVADYRHVPEGPGVMLIGHDFNYSMDNAGNRWGLLYNRKSEEPGENESRLGSALHAALIGCQLIEGDSSLAPPIRFSRNEFDLIINDRALAPNTQDTWQACTPIFSAFLNGALGHDDFELSAVEDPRERFTIQARTSRPYDLDALLAATK